MSMQKDKTCCAGHFRFRPETNIDQLMKFADETLATNPETWQMLYIRTSERADFWHLEFIYRLPTLMDDQYPEFDDELKKLQEKFVFDTSDTLKRRFGNDLISWDVSRPIYK